MRICNIDVFGGTPEERSRVSEILHNEIIGNLRMHLGRVLSPMQRVAVLIDDLDKGWEHREDLRELADFLFGSITVCRQIADDFNNERLNRPKIRLSIIAFLRTDIFHFIRQIVPEPDKLVYSQVSWSDMEILWQVVEKRFANFASNIGDDDISWRDFFVSEVNGTEIDKFVLQRVIPRPRDVIFLIRSSLANARNRNHSRIEEGDLIKAESEYSDFAIGLLLAEVSSVYPAIDKDLLWVFIGGNVIMTNEEIKFRLAEGGVSRQEMDGIILALVENCFFAVETNEEEFTFMYEDIERGRISAKSRKLKQVMNRERYRIHPAFHTALGICVDTHT